MAIARAVSRSIQEGICTVLFMGDSSISGITVGLAAVVGRESAGVATQAMFVGHRVPQGVRSEPWRRSSVLCYARSLSSLAAISCRGRLCGGNGPGRRWGGGLLRSPANKECLSSYLPYSSFPSDRFGSEVGPSSPRAPGAVAPRRCVSTEQKEIRRLEASIGGLTKHKIGAIILPHKRSCLLEKPLRISSRRK